MITRAQAEALLTLAESLEACERVGVEITLGDDCADVTWASGAQWNTVDQVNGKSIRAVVAERIPAQPTSPSATRY